MPTVVEVRGQKRTLMYSVEMINKRDERGRATGEVEEKVVEHKLPWDPSNKYGMQKLQRFVERGYTFDDPRKQGAGATLQVIEELVRTEPAPVDNESTEIKGEEGGSEIKCPECAFVAKNAWGLQQHMRKHYPDGVKRGRKKKRSRR